MKVSVIGAGLGGLAAACLLAKEGHSVEVFEKNFRPGGKMNLLESNGYRFDTGPSLLTMPFILEQLFKECGENLQDYISLVPLQPLCRYFYPDGTIFNNYSDRDSCMQEIKSFAPEDVQAYSDFLDYSAQLYNKTSDAFVFNPLYGWEDLKNLNPGDFLGIDAFKTVSAKVDQQFQSSYLRKFFKRFTTYNGSSPYQAPATLNVIPHVEINQGGYYVQGGLYEIARALYSLAEKLNVDFRFNTPVKKIIIRNQRVTGIQIEDRYISSDLVLANSDYTNTLDLLIEDDHLTSIQKKRARSVEPSCSGFVLMLGINHQYDKLAHHNIFFSRNYEKEFHQIFRDKVMPDDPTIYIANTSHSDPDHAPDGHSNLFILVNAPYLSDKYDWQEQSEFYRNKVIHTLEQRGLDNLSGHIQFSEVLNPGDFYDLYLSNRGSIYGTSSNNRLAAFLRPRNKSRHIEGLYFTGGSTHPGGGIPLVIQSAFNARDLIGRYT